MKTDYKPTLNLPRTDFPMRASLAKREPATIERWAERGAYDAMIERRRAQNAPRYVFHDGPPYANGAIHTGHILNKALKDFVVKYRSMTGHLCEFVPGWDCHGLPIEHEVDRALGKKKRAMSRVEIRQACRDWAARFVEVQAEGFRRVSVLADWEHPYLTMDPAYEAATVRELGSVFDAGLAYQGLKPVHWDWAAQTALAEAEVEYAPFTTEHVYVAFPFPAAPDWLSEASRGAPIAVAIWTTTPWTLPANLAIALHPDLTYALVAHGDRAYVIAEGLLSEVAAALKWDDGSFETALTFEGRRLVGELGEGAGLAARHPFIERDAALLPADYVTLEQGTGCVHTAPGHGQDDYVLGLMHNLEPISPVDRYGKFVEAPGTDGLVGTQVHRANPAIVARLHEAGALLNRPGEKVTIDRYPHGWRSKKPVIFRSTTQWFIAMDRPFDGGASLRERAQEAVGEVEWIPGWGRDRIAGMIASRPDWCISRQRLWGVPITALHCDECGETMATGELARHVADLVASRGVDVWFELDPSELAPPGAACAGCGARSWHREEAILDVWFDSGTSWRAVLVDRAQIERPADLYLEGGDQHRGWFQSSLMCSLISRQIPPYRACLTHGFVTDPSGKKYSKSSKNFEPPERMIETLGAEILRFWTSGVDYRGDITLSKEILSRVSDAYRKVRNTLRFLAGALYDFDPATDAVPAGALEPIDAWAVGRLADLVDRARAAYEACEFHTVYHSIVGFATIELSSFYLDVTKDRMYCELPDGPERRSGQTAYWMMLRALSLLIAPILSFTADEIWAAQPRAEGDDDLVFLNDIPTGDALRSGLAPSDASRWDRLLELRHLVQRALEAKRAPKKGEAGPDRIGSSAEAELVVTASGGDLELLESYGAPALAALFIVSRVRLVSGEVPGADPIGVEVRVSEHAKCPRCWNHWVESKNDGEPCERCRGVLVALDAG